MVLAPTDATEVLPESNAPTSRARGFQVEVLDGNLAGTTMKSKGPRLTIGTFPSNDVVLEDSAVSRVHCEVALEGRGLWVRDLSSKNGTLLDGVRIQEAAARDGSTIRVGRTGLRVRYASDAEQWPISDRTSFGTLVGSSHAMRASFALLERAADTDVTVLLEGETGTGKEEAARSLHAASSRKAGPFVVVDCGALPEDLIERELFGHEKGSFTGAVERRAGAFEAASGGTIFLDEIGELPLALQPTFLRVLERKEVRRIGSTNYQRADVRVVAASNRDLRAEVNEGTFRADLYFRLAVLRVVLPPLRSRPEDLAPIVRNLLPGLAHVSKGDPSHLSKLVLTDDYLAELGRGAWPGNVRELRNHLERCAVMARALPLAEMADREAPPRIEMDVSVPFRVARLAVLEAFEAAYVEALMRAHGGNISQAARASGMGRVSLYALLKRHKLR